MKLALTLCLLGLGIIIGVAVMINGWGLEVESWGWVIGGWLASTILTIVGVAVGNLD